MAAFSKFDAFVQDLGRKAHNLHIDTLKIALTLAAPLPTNAVLADVTQIASGNGYTAGGSALTGQSYAQTSGVAVLVAADLVFTAAGGSMAPFRYAVLYNATAAGGPLIGWYDAGGTITLADTETFTVDIGASILTLA
jgi:hypothetical protein